MEEERVLMEEKDMERSLARMAHEIIERNDDLQSVVLAGIRRRGVPLARALAFDIEKFGGRKIPVGQIDITLYRDDLTKISEDPRTGETVFPVSVKGKTVVLVDDVIYTGRTARAAMDAVFSKGRARKIQLAELVDRGHRELPIKPDFVGKNVPTSRDEIVEVKVQEIDGINQVCIRRTAGGQERKRGRMYGTRIQD